ncbi:MAG: HAD hydrolase family protein [Candidatus Moduliflexus flocculans]|nr:HAD hydrolase family protein [Candidatus Moduliflexus flocculans]
MMPHTIIFSDLDGTLLDDQTYSYEPARDALEIVMETGTPLVFCTSKTRSETERWRGTLANVHPFIVENGGAVFVPEGYFGPDAGFDKRDGGYGILEFGRPYPEIRQALEGIRGSTGLPLRGFGDMTVEEIAARCGFTRQDAALAATREYDEPFIGIEEGDAAPGRSRSRSARLSGRQRRALPSPRRRQRQGPGGPGAPVVLRREPGTRPNRRAG